MIGGPDPTSGKWLASEWSNRVDGSHFPEVSPRLVGKVRFYREILHAATRGFLVKTTFLEMTTALLLPSTGYKSPDALTLHK